MYKKGKAMLNEHIFIAMVMVVSLVIIKESKRSYFTMVVIYLPGVILHELMHYIVASILAKPLSFSVWPKKEGSQVTLGTVKVAGVNWLTSAPIAMAPLLLVPVSYFVFMQSIQFDSYLSKAIGLFLTVNILNSATPSIPDFKAMLRYPVGVLFYGVVLFMVIREWLWI